VGGVAGDGADFDAERGGVAAAMRPRVARRADALA
jgi:hypothetical protein